MAQLQLNYRTWSLQEQFKRTGQTSNFATYPLWRHFAVEIQDWYSLPLFAAHTRTFTDEQLRCPGIHGQDITLSLFCQLHICSPLNSKKATPSVKSCWGLQNPPRLFTITWTNWLHRMGMGWDGEARRLFAQLWQFKASRLQATIHVYR